MDTRFRRLRSANLFDAYIYFDIYSVSIIYNQRPLLPTFPLPATQMQSRSTENGRTQSCEKVYRNAHKNPKSTRNVRSKNALQ